MLNSKPSEQPDRPLAGSVEAWAYDYITSTALTHKLNPPSPPKSWQPMPQPLRLVAPGRPEELLRVRGRLRPPRSLQSPRARAKVLHTFFHHELQAAELMCWALLAFASAEAAFRRGLVQICLDEVRHMNLYKEHIEQLGFELGDFPARDWFWKRIPDCTLPVHFVATMGMGLEAANLEFAAQFADKFDAMGDTQGASIQRQVMAEEIPHVKFAVSWFRRWTMPGEATFAAWSAALRPPLTPMLMRGRPLNQSARSKAGVDAAFLAELDAWSESLESRS